MAKDRQMLLDLGGTASFDRDDLIVTPSNAEAVRLVDAWPDWGAPMGIIVGPTGSGKTHLASVWAAASQAYRVADPLAPGADDLAAAEAGQPILCDGLGPDALDETALFHLINAVRSGGTTMLATASSAPAHWRLKTPDLASRLRAATVATLDLPDDALLQAVALKLFADRQIVVDPAVIGYVIDRIERSLPALIDVVQRLDEAALARKSRITRPLAASVLDGLAQGNLDS